MMASRTAWLMLLCLALLCTTAVCADSALIYTTPNSDGQMSRAVGYSDGYTWDYFSQNRTATHARAVYRDLMEYNESYGWSSYYNSDYVVLQFPIASLRGSTLVPNSVKLHIYCYSAYSYGDTTAALYGANFDGGGILWHGGEGYNMWPSQPLEWEATGTITHSQVENCCNSALSRLGYIPISPTAAWREVDVTADLQRQINAGYDWAGYFFSMRHAFDGQNFRILDVATYEDVAHRPYLEIVPEPSSLLAMMAGITGLGCTFIRRRK